MHKREVENISKTSIQSYLRHLCAFINYLHAEGYISEDLSSKFKLPKAPKKTIEILSDEEIELLQRLDPQKCVKTVHSLKIYI